MQRPFECPDCKCHHDEPAEAAYLLAVRCLDCELETLFRAHRPTAAEPVSIARAA